MKSKKISMVVIIILMLLIGGTVSSTAAPYIKSLTYTPNPVIPGQKFIETAQFINVQPDQWVGMGADIPDPAFGAHHPSSNPYTYSIEVLAPSYPFNIYAVIYDKDFNPVDELIINLDSQKPTPLIAWNSNEIIEGNALGSSQFCAIAKDPNSGEDISNKGTFTYSNFGTKDTLATGSKLDAGQYILKAVFTPNSVINYGQAEIRDTINVLTPEDGTKKTVTTVQGLVSSGVLNDGQGQALTVKLELARAYLEAGDTKKALNELNALVNQLNSLIAGSTDNNKKQALQALLDEVNAIIKSIS